MNDGGVGDGKIAQVEIAQVLEMSEAGNSIVGDLRAVEIEVFQGGEVLEVV